MAYRPRHGSMACTLINKLLSNVADGRPATCVVPVSPHRARGHIHIERGANYCGCGHIHPPLFSSHLAFTPISEGWSTPRFQKCTLMRRRRKSSADLDAKVHVSPMCNPNTHTSGSLRGSTQGAVFNLAVGLATLAASVVAGALWEAVGPAATFLGGAGFTGVALFGLAATRRRFLLPN